MLLTILIQYVCEMQPYLIRRAQENADVLGGTATEEGMMRKELLRRCLNV